MPRSRNRRSSSTRARRSLQLQVLEQRSLMAADLTATLDLSTQALRIEGTPGNDSIAVRQLAGQVSVLGILIKVSSGTVSVPVASIDRSLIKRVEVLALAGNDIVNLQELSLAATAAAA